MNPDDLLVLSSRDVQDLLSLDECIEVVEHAFRLHGLREVAPPAVLSMHTHGGGFHIKAGLLELRRSYFAAKVNGNFPENYARFGLPTIQGVIVLCDSENGTPLAIMDSAEITSLRTAAATAVAAKYLARDDSRIATICGCGVQGRLQLKALSRIAQLEQLFVYDKDSELASRFADASATCLNISVKAVTNLSSAVQQSDICVTCTPSQNPLLFSDDVAPGTFIAAVGADNPSKQELDPALLAKCKIVCDVVEQCAVMGDLHHALDAGLVTRADVHAELGEVVAAIKAGRESDKDIIIFDSTGMALQDVAAAACLYEKAEQQGAGVQLTLAASGR
jgi:alanine dehydrogenase